MLVINEYKKKFSSMHMILKIMIRTLLQNWYYTIKKIRKLCLMFLRVLISMYVYILLETVQTYLQYKDGHLLIVPSCTENTINSPSEISTSKNVSGKFIYHLYYSHMEILLA